MKKLLFMITLVVTLVAFVPFTRAALIMQLDTEFSGATPPAGSTPWLTATFDDGGTPGSVTLTMEATNLVGSEFVSWWGFNFNPALDITALNAAYTSGALASNLTISENCCKADGDGFFDIVFEYNNGVFGAGDTSVYEFTLAGITANDFNFLSAPGGGNGSWGTGAHVQGIDPNADKSGWVGGGGFEETPIPEPATLLLVSSGLTGLGLLRRKLRARS